MSDTTTTEQVREGKPTQPRHARVILRVPWQVHEALRRAAYEQRTSINKLANDELLRLSTTFSAQNQI